MKMKKIIVTGMAFLAAMTVFAGFFQYYDESDNESSK